MHSVTCREVIDLVGQLSYLMAAFLTIDTIQVLIPFYSTGLV